MTGNEMLTQLGQRLEDTNEEVFSETIKLEALNNNMLFVCELLNWKQLRVLIDTATSTAATSGILNMSTFASTPLLKESDDIHAGITKLKISSGSYIEYTPEDQLAGVVNNTYLTPTAKSPKWYLNGVASSLPIINILPASTVNVDYEYLKKPTVLIADATECELEENQHKIILDFAEGALWSTINRDERATKAENLAKMSISALNGEVVE